MNYQLCRARADDELGRLLGNSRNADGHAAPRGANASPTRLPGSAPEPGFSSEAVLSKYVDSGKNPPYTEYKIEKLKAFAFHKNKRVGPQVGVFAVYTAVAKEYGEETQKAILAGSKIGWRTSHGQCRSCALQCCGRMHLRLHTPPASHRRTTPFVCV